VTRSRAGRRAETSNHDVLEACDDESHLLTFSMQLLKFTGLKVATD